LRRALDEQPAFDPKVARNTFRIVSGDYAEHVLIPPLIAKLSVEAPLIDIWFEPSRAAPLERLASGDIDAVIGLSPQRHGAAQVRYVPLLTDEFVSLARAGHALSRGRITPERYAAERHVFVAPGGTRGGVVDDALAALNLQRRVAVAVPHFLVAPHVVATSDLVLTVGSRLGDAFANMLSLYTFTPPVELPGFELGLFWHARHEEDAAHQYLRTTLQSVAMGLPAVTGRGSNKRLRAANSAKSRRI
jgi:DNA-binding transcriptional LysR family regulator